jgi:hypothetical protein
MFYYPIVVAVLTLLSQGNLTHVTIALNGKMSVSNELARIWKAVAGACCNIPSSIYLKELIKPLKSFS